MKAESMNYDIETGEELNLSKNELNKSYKLIKREKNYVKKFDTIVWQSGWKKTKNEQYRQGNLFC